MQVEQKEPGLEAILEVFRELGLDDAERQKRLQELAKPSGRYRLGKKQDTPLETRNNTLMEEQYKDVELEPTS